MRGNGRLFSQEHCYVPGELCNEVRPVVLFGVAVSTEIDPKHSVAISKVVDLRGLVPAARFETMDEEKRLPNSPLGIVQLRTVNDMTRHGIIRLSETARGRLVSAAERLWVTFGGTGGSPPVRS